MRRLVDSGGHAKISQGLTPRLFEDVFDHSR
jgi:hypothetical protein